MTLDVSVAFATGYATPDHVVLAEQLGFKRAWLYDSPALYPDVWITLAECARRTSRIGLGPGVLVPSLRHPMVNAAAIAHLEHLAPGRVNVAIGSGFTGRLTLGQRPLAWSWVREYIICVQGLLAGRTMQWEGASIAMMHPDGFAPQRPIVVPFIVGAGGPKGMAVARELADGIFSTQPESGCDWCNILAFGTVLDDGEAADSERAIAAAGHGAAVALHAMYDRGYDLSGWPGGPHWLASLADIDPTERHLALHDLHLIGVNNRDRPMITAELMTRAGGARNREQWHTHFTALEAAGATEISYQPAGPDIEEELSRFAQMLSVSTQSRPFIPPST